MRLKVEMNVFSLVRRRRSKTLLRVLKMEIGRWFEADLGSLPGLGIMTTVAFFQESGEYLRRAEPLKM